jgi:glycogen(starch) synthase
VKILIYSPKFYPSVGGLENLTLMLSNEFIKKGHEVKVICFEKDNGSSCGVETYYHPSVFKQLQLFWWASVFYMPNISLKGLWLMFTNPMKRWVISHNGWYGPDIVSKRKSFNEKAKLFLLHFAKNISVSNAVASYITVNSTVIPNCYDNNIFHANYNVKRENNVLFVGRLVSDKGVDVLINACQLLWQKGKDFTLTIIGQGEMHDWVKQKIQAYGIENKVSLKGKVVGEELAKAMNEHTIMAVPSTWNEPFGIVALEGLACGCKVICSSGGGLPEAVGEFGHFFSNGNQNTLSALIENNLQEKYSPDLERLASFLENHQPSKVAEKYLHVFYS